MVQLCYVLFPLVVKGTQSGFPEVKGMGGEGVQHPGDEGMELGQGGDLFGEGGEEEVSLHNGPQKVLLFGKIIV